MDIPAADVTAAIGRTPLVRLRPRAGAHVDVWAKLEAANDGQQSASAIRPPEAGVWHGEDFSI